MEKLKKHGPILTFIAVLGICGFLIWNYHDKPEEVMTEERFDPSIRTVSSRLTSSNVDPDYTYSVENKEKLKQMPATVESNVTRLTRTIDNGVGVYVAYPRPTRPRSAKVDKDVDPIPVYASMGPLTNVKAHPDQGTVYVQFDIPKPDDLKLMDLVRVEVFRGTDPKKIDTTKVFGTVELGPEEPVAKTAAPATTVAPVVEERKRGQAPTPRGPKPPAVQVPKYTRAFRDTDVEQTTTYYYQLKLVGRFTSLEGKFKMNEVNGQPVAGHPGFTHHAPDKDPVLGKSYTPAASRSGAPVQLFALPLTETVNAKTPYNFAIRLEGVIGTPPPQGVIRNPQSPEIRDYAARFEIKVWKADMEEGKLDHIQVKEGDMLSGKMRYKAKGSGEAREYDYTNDVGYKFIEIIQKEDKDSKIKGQLTDTAVLENLKTKQKEELAKASNPKARSEAILIIEEALRQQEEAKKKSGDTLKAGLDKNKEEQAKRNTSPQ